MTLKQWESNGWLKKHKTSGEEIGNLLEIVKRDIKDAQEDAISDDWRFGTAYNAALKLCTILLYAEGYRPEKVWPISELSNHCPSSLVIRRNLMPHTLTPVGQNEIQWSMILSEVPRQPMLMN